MASSSSLYPYPSTLNPSSFVSMKLSSSQDYPLWKTQMLCLLESQELAGFIDGSIRMPPEKGGTTAVGEADGDGKTAVVVNEEYRVWKRSDRLVKGWILGSLQQDVLATVVGCSTAMDVWTKLLSTFGSNLQGHQEAEAVVAARHAKTFKDYPDLSMVNAANFISVKLTRTNYNAWRMQIICLFRSQDLFSFISSPTPPEIISILNDKKSIKNEAYRLRRRLDSFSIPSPAPPEIISILNDKKSIKNEAYRLWSRLDFLLKGWILGSITEDLLPLVTDSITSRDALATLEDIFLKDERHRIFSHDLETANREPQEGTVVAAPRQAITLKDYPYPANVNVGNFVSVKLCRTNYSIWMVQILSLIRSQDFYGFIFSSAPSEVVSNENDNSINSQRESILRNDACKLWRRSDLLLKGWILGSITEDILPLVADLPTSRNVLAKLEETFLTNDKKRIFSENTKTEEQVVWERNDVSLYLPLYKAALEGDWETAKEFLDRTVNAATAIITVYNETVLHVAVGTGKANHFVEKLVERLPEYALNLKTSSGDTALSIAAMVGNVDAIKILMKRNPSLLSTRDGDGDLPLVVAISFGQRSTSTYLHSNGSYDIYAGDTAVALLCALIIAEFYDLALEWVKRYPHAASLHIKEYKPLNLIAGKVSAFQSGMHLNYVESFIYSCVPVKFENYLNMPNRSDIDVENPSYNNSQTVHEKVQLREVPRIKSIRHKKLVHHQAVQLVKYLCEGVKSSLHEDAYLERTSEPITKAASLGVFEVVEEIAYMLPYAMRSTDESGYYLHQIAVVGRCEKVFNLLYRMSGYQNHFIPLTDNFKNGILHLAGRLAPPHKLNLVSGAALQMQRELQWFQEVEKHTHPGLREFKNSSGETPAMIFTREHKELLIEGEKWMKDTANSCTIAAALIITIVFAAAITVPGGNNGDNGHPNFSGIAFLLFAVSDAISLFTSTTSLLMFLSILTARYAEQDFLHELPARLVVGLFTLFLAITSMVIAFSSAVYLVFGDNRRWVIIALATLSSLPISSFVALQLPLLGAVYSSTYGRGIFVKQSDRPVYQFK